MQVCNITTPANYFHLLRRQVKRDFRKPLVVMTPKKLLRHPRAVSSLAEMAKGRFQEVLDDTLINKKDVDTVVLCSGKVYYEALEEREKLGADNIALVRVEQLYPLPEKQIREVLASYGKKIKLVWLQEEPENMGAASYMLLALRDLALECISLPASASPAAGSPKIHEHRMRIMMGKLFSYAKEKA
jgi:2-oxoglutarate dehydrogenase E1 component